MSTITINGSETASLGFPVTSVGAIYSPAAVARQYTALPGRYGVVPMGGARGAVRVLPVSFALRSGQSTLLSARQGLRRDFLTLLGGGMLDVRLEDQPGVRYWCMVDTPAIEPRFASVQFLNGELAAQVDFVVPSGVAEDVEITSRALPADEKVYFDDDDLGDQPSPTLIVVPGEALSYRCEVWMDGAEDSAIQIQAGEGPSSSETMELDGEARRIVVEGTGFPARVERYDLFGSGDFPVLEPDRADTHLLASHDSTVYYRRLWR